MGYSLLAGFISLFLFFPDKALSEDVSNSQDVGLKSSQPSADKTFQNAETLEQGQEINDKEIELAQSSSRRCRNAPWIDQAVLFQSVEAPQIEPLQQQYEDRQGFPYGEYDLVKRKPAVLFVDIRGLRRKTALLQAFVDKRLYFEEKIRGNQTYFPLDLPMREGGLLDGIGSARLFLRLIPDEDISCYDQISFKVTVWETKKLDLRFAKITNGNCKPLNEYPLFQIGRTYEESYNRNNLPYWPYESVRDREVENFKFSDEVQHYLPEMLPVSEDAFRIYREIIDLKGHCDNSPVRKYEPAFRRYSTSIGILEDINELERQRIKRGGEENKIVAIMPKDYLSFHDANSFNKEDATKAVDVYGFVLHRREYEASRKFLWWEWSTSRSGGSSHVIFVREDAYDDGSLSHELGHSLGQRKEFYEKKNQCRDFKYQINKNCDQYTIDRSLKFGKIEKNLLSIMHSGESPISQKWIDRETFQKTFAYLLKEENRRSALDILNSPLNRDEAVSRDISVKKEPIVIISGIYLKSENPEEEKFLYDPKIEVYKEGGLLTRSFEEGDIQVELKLGEEIIYINRFSSFAEIEFLRDERGNPKRTRQLFSVPITVSLPLKYGLDKDYEIIIKQMNGSLERVLFSSKLSKAE